MSELKKCECGHKLRGVICARCGGQIVPPMPVCVKALCHAIDCMEHSTPGPVCYWVDNVRAYYGEEP